MEPKAGPHSGAGFVRSTVPPGPPAPQRVSLLHRQVKVYVGSNPCSLDLGRGVESPRSLWVVEKEVG